MRLTSEPLRLDDALSAVRHPQAGGVGVFAGTVRDHREGRAVAGLRYEAWEEQAAVAMREVAERVLRTHGGVRAVHLAHRVGELGIGEVSVVVAASAPHRDEAMAAAVALIDTLKATVPIWKHERFRDGAAWWPGAESLPGGTP